jgi:hypothetical protein
MLLAANMSPVMPYICIRKRGNLQQQHSILRKQSLGRFQQFEPGTFSQLLGAANGGSEASGAAYIYYI